MTDMASHSVDQADRVGRMLAELCGHDVLSSRDGFCLKQFPARSEPFVRVRNLSPRVQKLFLRAGNLFLRVGNLSECYVNYSNRE